MEFMRVKLTLTEDILGTASANPEIHAEYIASKGPDAQSVKEEVEAIGADAVLEKGMTVFPLDEDGDPMLWDYQIKGFFKDTAGMLKKVSGTISSGVKAYKKEIDGLFFIKERRIKIHNADEITICQRPLRAQTAQGERVALTSSESIPAGAWLEFTIICMRKGDMKLVREWLDYGKYRGLGQWRNSGKGRFSWEELHAWTDEDGDADLYD